MNPTVICRDLQGKEDARNWSNVDVNLGLFSLERLFLRVSVDDQSFCGLSSMFAVIFFKRR
jgi:hypothetical protein